MSLDGSPLIEALGWIQATLLGSAAVSVAILAIATIGLLAFTGNMPIRRAITAVFGCFILFSAHSIATGIIGQLSGEEASALENPPLLPERQYIPSLPDQTPYDPYAGAAVPVRPPGQPILQ